VRINVKQRYISESVGRIYEGKPTIEPEGNVVSWQTPANLIDYDISFEHIEKKDDKRKQFSMTTGTNPNFVPLGPTLPKLDAWNCLGRDKGNCSSSDSYHDAYDGDGEPDDYSYTSAEASLKLADLDEFPSLLPAHDVNTIPKLLPKRDHQDWEAREPVMVTADEFNNLNIDDVEPGESCIMFEM